MFVNSRLKATRIIGQRKAFYKQRISASLGLQWNTFATLLAILNVSFLLFTSIGNVFDGTKSLPQRKVTNKLKRCCLFLMLWKNANHSLLGSNLCSKLSRRTHVSDTHVSLISFFSRVVLSTNISIKTVHTLYWSWLYTTTR